MEEQSPSKTLNKTFESNSLWPIQIFNWADERRRIQREFEDLVKSPGSWLSIMKETGRESLFGKQSPLKRPNPYEY